MTADLCKNVDSRQRMPDDVLYRKGQELREVRAVEEQETEEFWRKHYKTLSKHARAEIDRHLSNLPDTDEVAETDYAQAALDAPQEFQERLVMTCGSRVARTLPQQAR